MYQSELAELEQSLENLNLDLRDEPLNNLQRSLQQVDHQKERRKSIEQYVQLLVHACFCNDQQCRQLPCMKMKRLVAHTRICKRITSGSCPIREQVITLCEYHAKHCPNDENCLVPFCSVFKDIEQLQFA